MGLIKKCKTMVNKLHYKGLILKDEAEHEADKKEFKVLLQMIEQAKSEQDAEEDVVYMTDDSDEKGESSGGKHPDFITLKNEVATRWNSTYTMLNSLTSQIKIVDRALKKVGETTLQKQEWQVLSQVTKFLENFKDLTELVSGSTAELSLLPLIKAEIQSLCSSDPKDLAELEELKKRILKNLDARMQFTDDVLQVALLDPAMKDLEILGLYFEKKRSVLQSLERENPSSEADEPQDGNREDYTEDPSTSKVSKRQKLLMKHSAVSSDKTLKGEILTYLSTSGDPLQSPIDFWQSAEDKYPLLSKHARKALCRNAASVPVESLFSTMGLILNSKRSSLTPYRANQIVFVHDNSALYI